MSKNEIVLKDNLIFATVANLNTQLQKELGACQANTILLNLSAILYCDSAGLAFILEAKKACLMLKKKFEICGVSEKMKTLAEFCGLQDILCELYDR